MPVARRRVKVASVCGSSTGEPAGFKARLGSGYRNHERAGYTAAEAVEEGEDSAASTGDTGSAPTAADMRSHSSSSPAAPLRRFEALLVLLPAADGVLAAATTCSPFAY